MEITHMHLLFKLVSKIEFFFLFCPKDALKLPACHKPGAGQFIDFSEEGLALGFWQ